MTCPDAFQTNSTYAPGPAIRIAFLVGMALSVLAMGAGMILAVAGGRYANESVPLKTILPSILRLDPSAFIALGALILMTTPLAGLIAAIVRLLGRRNRDAVIGLLVLAMLVVSFALAQR